MLFGIRSSNCNFARYINRVKLFHNIITSVLLLVVLTGAMKNSVLLMYYQVDSTAFINTFCVNKDRPQLHCDGKCKLSQILKEKERKAANETLVSLQAEYLLFQPTEKITLQLPTLQVTTQPAPVAVYSNLYQFQFLSRTDRPPQTIA